ncbi:MAG: hypothetical protein ABII71_04005 [Candidatus Micrarchaeota archaeon]
MSLVILVAFGDSLLMLLALVNGFSCPDLPTLLIGIFAGVLGALAFIPYMEAIHREEVSRVILLLNLVPLFVLVISFSFLMKSLLLPNTGHSHASLRERS